MNIEQFANSLNNRQHLEEITKEEEKFAAKNNWLVVFGYSDDNIELRGAIYEELGAWNGTTIYLLNGELLEYCECECKYYIEAKNKSKIIKANWNDSSEEFCWTIESDVKHYNFEILDGEDKFCKGAVFDIRDFKNE